MKSKEKPFELHDEVWFTDINKTFTMRANIVVVDDISVDGPRYAVRFKTGEDYPHSLPATELFRTEAEALATLHETKPLRSGYLNFSGGKNEYI
jgi:hypothetical protein